MKGILLRVGVGLLLLGVVACGAKKTDSSTNPTPRDPNVKPGEPPKPPPIGDPPPIKKS